MTWEAITRVIEAQRELRAVLALRRACARMQCVLPLDFYATHIYTR